MQEVSVGDFLRSAVQSAPDAVALIEGAPDPAARRRWTYEKLFSEAETCARALLSRYEPGDKVAIWAPNVPEYQVLQYGVALAGMTLVTINPTFRVPEAQYVIDSSGAACCFTVEEFRGRSPLQSALEVQRAAAGLRDVFTFSHWGEFLTDGQNLLPLPRVDPRSPAQVLYTSGTTGLPKGAMLPHVGMTNNIPVAARRIAAGNQAPSVWMVVLPMFHLAGCVVAALGSVAMRGAVLSVLNFEPELALRLIEQERVTTTNLVSTMMLAMLQHPSFPERDVSSLHSVYLGGGPIPPALVRRLERDLGIIPIIGYGMTEAAVVTTTTADDTPEDRESTCGSAVPGAEVRIVHPETGQVLGCGQVGEVQTRGDHTMIGYLGNPAATAAAFTDDRWMRTGDLCVLDERGYLKVVGRAKEMIIRGGENIYPREIEDELVRHEALAEAAVIGLPDDYYGEVVAAFVRLRDGYQVSATELRASLKERLTGHKVPTRWYFVDEYPKTPSGKIQKGELRKLWEQDLYTEADA